MSLFSLFHTKKPKKLVVDERVITPEFLRKHNVEIRHLVDESWAAWKTGGWKGDSGGIDRDSGQVWTSESNVHQYVLCKTRDDALVAAVRYLASTGVSMPSPQPTGCPIPDIE